MPTKEQTAFHEAGHAVAIDMLGLGIDYILMKKDNASDNESWEGDTKRIRETANGQQFVVAGLAGPLAEIAFGEGHPQFVYSNTLADDLFTMGVFDCEHEEESSLPSPPKPAIAFPFAAGSPHIESARSNVFSDDLLRICERVKNKEEFCQGVQDLIDLINRDDIWEAVTALAKMLIALTGDHCELPGKCAEAVIKKSMTEPKTNQVC